MIGAIGGVFAALVFAVGSCVPCDCSSGDVGNCDVIIGFPDPVSNTGPYNLSSINGFTFETWKMTCQGHLRALKIDQSPNNPRGGVVNVYLHFPPNRMFLAGDYTFDASGCWGSPPIAWDKWGNCYINAIIQG